MWLGCAILLYCHITKKLPWKENYMCVAAEGRSLYYLKDYARCVDQSSCQRKSANLYRRRAGLRKVLTTLVFLPHAWRSCSLSKYLNTADAPYHTQQHVMYVIFFPKEYTNPWQRIEGTSYS